MARIDQLYASFKIPTRRHHRVQNVDMLICGGRVQRPTHSPPGEYGLGHPSPPIIKPQHVHSSPPLPTYLLPTAPSRKNKMNIRPNRIPALSKKHNPHREQHSVYWWKSHSRSGVWSANWNAADSCSDCSSGGDGRCFRFWGKGKSGRDVRARGWRLGKLMTLLFDLVEVT